MEGECLRVGVIQCRRCHLRRRHHRFSVLFAVVVAAVAVVGAVVGVVKAVVVVLVVLVLVRGVEALLAAHHASGINLVQTFSRQDLTSKIRNMHLYPSQSPKP